MPAPASSGAPHVFHSSACVAVMRSIRGLAVPTRIGSGDCTGFGIHRRVGDRVVRALERGALVREQAAHDLDRLLEPVDTGDRRLEFDAVRVVLVDLPAGADAEHQPAVGDVVDRRRPVGEDRRMVHRRGSDERAEAHAFGDRGDRGQHRPALVHVAGRDRLAAGVRHVVVGVPEAVPTFGVGETGQFEDLGHGTAGVGPHGELHRADRSLAPVSDDLWEEHAAWWIDGFTDGADPEYEEQILPLARAELTGFDRVLDVGCGDGQISRMMAAAGSTVVGVDPTWNQIAVAGERGGGPSYVRAGAAELPFADGSFDAAVACLVFEHIDDVHGAIDEIARVVRPGGRFCFFLNHPLLQTPGSGWISDYTARPARVVLAHRPVPRRAGLGRAGRARCLHPLHPPAAVDVRQRARAKPGWCSSGWSSPRRRTASSNVPPSTRRRPRSRACCTSACAEPEPWRSPIPHGRCRVG